MAAERAAARPAGRVLWYLSCELPTEGQASHTHITGITRGLEALGWRTRLFHPAIRRGRRGAVRRLLDMTTMQLGLMATIHRPDVLYVRGHFASLLAVLWAWIRRVPVVWELNGPGTDILSSWPALRPVLGLLLVSINIQVRLSSATIGVTPALADAARARGARQVFVVPNGADTELFAPSARTSAELPARFVSFIGTLARWQGINTVIDALGRPAWPADVSLVVVGDGVMAETVRERAALDSRLVYLGRVDHKEVGGIIARGICGLSPMVEPGRSLSGVVPLKLFEALACGVAVIVTDLPGQADIVRRDDVGIVIPPGDPDALAAAVARLASDPDAAQAMGRRARAVAVDQYSWASRAAETSVIIEGVLR
jgi:glycosyltransferase involved in cell wall biosynthesis